MKKILQYLFEYKTLSREKAKEVLVNMSRGQYNEAEMSAFITVFLMRTITIEELLGFRDALLELCVKVDLKGYPVMDIVGTGGDGKNTFNISTLSCFIVAGAGQRVSKHGNYGATAISGASNVMEQLGYTFKNDNDRLLKELETANICFLHAPMFHPAMKIVGPIRKNLGVRTFFNMLGPMINPAEPDFQLVGVYNLEMARIYNYLLQQTSNAFTIIHSLDGYDEISLTGDTKVITQDGEKIMTPEQLGKRIVAAEDIYGGNSVEEAARIFTRIIKGEGSWAQNAVVLANAAMALHCTGNYISYDAAYLAAVESLESGKAYRSLQTLISLQ
ncbi:MAG: anthranilate phosphoribosyltransferase [Chitinophagaceae bacterium]|nr:anthranilate phosphoribosyltransferase [Chitinophagaceae bacterium]MCA6453261.1 anthranilate phosphoribosyltransferase [Chitinophagaceae bacterium]MCA6454496.1 anthranilate phosphoribosyltransferase [Chitinophagaceae bacterium]MCA6459235.1 anthranilate phosphoribosyltransferase [Chitinophagaceae bacterium]MCA6464605.1 anthranilate phosphoribosyltransferase [Chitinophagaceae bacterium]